MRLELIWLFCGATLLIGNVHVAAVTTVTCPTAGFTLSPNETYCFALSEYVEQWPAKSISCRLYNAHLATAESEEKHSEIQAWLTAASVSSSEDKIWMGLTNSLTDKTWVWWGKGVASYVPWYSGYPKGIRLENCGYMTWKSRYDFKNQQCLQKAMALCEMEPTDSVL